MKILAIETSCDETAAAVVEDGRAALSNVIASQIEEHKAYGGVVPEIASRRHSEAICAVVGEALETARVTLKDLEAVAVTYAPGLIGALLVGVNYAKGLSYAAGLPLVPVHHLRSHIAANYPAFPELAPPFLALVVSGGHSHLVQVESYTDFHVLGRTRDDAAGEALDKAARALGLAYPGGVNLDRLCSGGDGGAYTFPTPHVDGSELDFSFSGLKTSVLNLINREKQRGNELNVTDIGASYLHSVAKILTDHAEKAARQCGAQKLVLAGGVSANSVLRRYATEMCRKNGIKLYMPPLQYCTDNAVMVGAQGYYEYVGGKRADLTLNAYATMEIGEQE